MPRVALGSLAFDLDLLLLSAELCWPCFSFCLLKIPFLDLKRIAIYLMGCDIETAV